MTVTDLTSEWFDHADSYFRIARLALNGLFEPNQKDLALVCYHCRQAAEKALKGYLISRNIEPPRLHHLGKLIEKCAEFDAEFATLAEIAVRLTDYGVNSRYPGEIAPFIDEKIIRTALSDAEKIYALAKKHLFD